MTRCILLRFSAGPLFLAALAGAASVGLTGVNGGVWEVAGHGPPVRLCLADPLMLAAYEHRAATCARRLVRSDGQTAVVSYTCSGGGFGQSQLSVITPRSLHIDTQGILDGQPYTYALDAHRIGDCSHH